MSTRILPFTAPPSAVVFAPSLVRPAQLRKMKGSEQAAAVCFRTGTTGIQFLLVRTGGGRWTFPKGSIESGLTHAQSAALEAFEEAGVHGRMENANFARYVHRKTDTRRNGEGSRQSVIHAHLCQVLRLGRPKESHRKPTWFSPEKTKQRLQLDRTPEVAAELIRVVDIALVRIRKLGAGTGGNQAWQRAYFEASQHQRSQRAVLVKTRGQYPFRRSPEVLNPRLISVQQSSRRLLLAASASKTR